MSVAISQKLYKPVTVAALSFFVLQCADEAGPRVAVVYAYSRSATKESRSSAGVAAAVVAIPMLAFVLTMTHVFERIAQ